MPHLAVAKQFSSSQSDTEDVLKSTPMKRAVHSTHIQEMPVGGKGQWKTIVFFSFSPLRSAELVLDIHQAVVGLGSLGCRTVEEMRIIRLGCNL